MENIRVTSGKFRGRVIKSPRSNFTHPMGAREKLALFNMIVDYLPGARVLDAFAGSGALGIEALSRGANEVVFVEKNPKVSRIIRENIENLGLTNKCEICVTEVKKFTADEMFDIIIADPPYDNFSNEEVNCLTNYLKNDGMLALSHPGFTPIINGLKLTKTHKYANANLSIYLKTA